jgi:hypothetical protein
MNFDRLRYIAERTELVNNVKQFMQLRFLKKKVHS